MTGAARVLKETNKCDECDSYLVSATYTKNSPFPGKRSEHTGCILCDTLLNTTIITFFAKAKKLPEDMNEDERKVYDEKKKKIEEKRKAKEQRKLEE